MPWNHDRPQYPYIATCGHEDTFFEPRRKRDLEPARKSWAAKPCRDCRHVEERAAAQLFTYQYGLPTLDGSEKQAQWAETIRAEQLRAWYAMLAQVPPADSQSLIMTSMISTSLESQTSSRWWIDHRENTIRELVTGTADITPWPCWNLAEPEQTATPAAAQPECVCDPKTGIYDHPAAEGGRCSGIVRAAALAREDCHATPIEWAAAIEEAEQILECKNGELIEPVIDYAA